MRLFNTILSLESFGKRTEAETKAQKADDEDEDDEDEENFEDDIFGAGKKLTSEEYHLFTFSQLATLLAGLAGSEQSKYVSFLIPFLFDVLLLTCHRHLFADVGDSLLHKLSAVLPTVDYPQLKLECADLLGQIGIIHIFLF